MEKELAIKNYYNNEYNEEDRLKNGCDNRHKIEFEYKKKVICEEVLKKNKPCNILDLSCGTGIYAIELAKLGHYVEASDLVEEHIEILNKKVLDFNLREHISTSSSNILNIDYGKKQFDVVLLGGAIYHLHLYEDKKKAVNNAKKYLKKDGILIIDFLPKLHGKIQNIILDSGILDNEEEPTIEIHNDIFSYNTVEEMKSIIVEKEYDMKFLTTDFISRFIKDDINNLSDEQLNKWIQLLEKVNENFNLVDIGEHALVICTKI